MSRPGDAALFERWKQGERKAGEELLGRHYKSVLRFFELNASYASQDLTQRTFVACIERVAEIRAAEAFRGYLMGIARRQLAMHLRAALRRDPSFDVDEVGATRLSTLVARTQQQMMLMQALAGMPRSAQVLLMMAYWDEVTPTEIARGMDVPASTVRTRLERARKLLRRRMQEFSADPKPLDDEELHRRLRAVIRRDGA